MTQRCDDFQVTAPAVAILGLPFHIIDLEGAVQAVCRAAMTRRRLLLSTPNVNFVIQAQKDAQFRNSVLASHISLADGMPIVWVSKLFGLPLTQRVSGADLFEALASRYCDHPLRVYFFGGENGVAERAAYTLNQQPRGLLAVGHQSPGFGSVSDLSDSKVLAAINSTDPDLLVVSISAKKGQEWILRNFRDLNAPVIANLGAVVNFTAGAVKRSPPIVARAGMEWLWRITQEPHLFARYTSDAVGLASLLMSIAGFKVLTHRRRFVSRALIPSIYGDAERFNVHLSGSLCETARRTLAHCLPPHKKPKKVDIIVDDLSDINPQGLADLMLWIGSLLRTGHDVRLRCSKFSTRREFGKHAAETLLDSNKPSGST